MSDDTTIVRLIPKPPTVPPGAITGPDWIDLTGRVATLEDGRDFGDLNDVTFASLANGQVPLWDAAANGGAGGWVNGTPQTGITVLEGTGGTVINTASNALLFRHGLIATDSVSDPGNRSVVDVEWGGTGSANTVARSDHAHSAVVGDILTGAATGVLSSGTRTLSSATTAALASGITFDLSATAIVRCRNNVDSGTVNLLFRIGTDASWPQRVRLVQTVGGVPVDQIIHFRGVFAGAGSGLAISWQIQHAGGSATDVRDYELEYEFKPRR